MSLAKLYHRLCRRLGVAERVFAGIVASKRKANNHQDWMLLEGLVSGTWQAWSVFCRDLIVASSIGCDTRKGIVVSNCVTPATWERVSYMAMRASTGNKILPSQTNNLLRKEPTWGDVNKLIEITNQISPANKAQLISAFGAGLRGPLHMQKIRNAAAHWNSETLGEVLGLRPYYISNPIRHPSEAAFWTHPSSNDYAFCFWIEDLRLLADIATE